MVRIFCIGLLVFLLLPSCKSGKVSKQVFNFETSQLLLIKSHSEDDDTLANKPNEIIGLDLNKNSTPTSYVDNYTSSSFIRAHKRNAVQKNTIALSNLADCRITQKNEQKKIKPNSLAYLALTLFLFGISILFVPYFGQLATLGLIIFFAVLIGSVVLSKLAMKRIAHSDNHKGYYLAKFVFIFSIIALSFMSLLYLFSI